MIGRGAVCGCAALLLLSAPAQALVAVVGAGMVHDCFIAAKAGNDPRGGIAICNVAPAFALASDQLKNFVVTRQPASPDQTR